MDAFRSWITPNEQFYVRNHFDDPDLDQSAWVLRVNGCVERDLRFTWEELDKMHQASLVATLECAGNGRSFLKGEVPWVRWGAGAVGNAEWSGVRVGSLLVPAGINPIQGSPQLCSGQWQFIQLKRRSSN